MLNPAILSRSWCTPRLYTRQRTCLAKEKSRHPGLVKRVGWYPRDRRSQSSHISFIYSSLAPKERTRDRVEFLEEETGTAPWGKTRNAKREESRERFSSRRCYFLSILFSLLKNLHIHTHIRVSFSIFHDENLEETGRMTVEEEKNKPGIVFGRCKSRTMQFHRASFFTTRSIFRDTRWQKSALVRLVPSVTQSFNQNFPSNILSSSLFLLVTSRISNVEKWNTFEKPCLSKLTSTRDTLRARVSLILSRSSLFILPLLLRD